MPLVFPLCDCEDVTKLCVARVPVQQYRTASLTSHSFGSLISSHDLYKERIKLGLSENLVYACLSDQNPSPSWYCLGKKPEKTTSSTGYWLMKIPMANSYSGHSKSSMASLRSTIFLIGQEVYSKLQALNCETHTWTETSRMIHYPRNVENSFVCATKDSIFVLGGFEEEGQTSLKLNTESYCPKHDRWTTLEEPDGLDIYSKVVLVGSIDGVLTFWSSSDGKSKKHLFDSESGKWRSQHSGLLPSTFRDYSHTLFVGSLVIRIIGSLLLWFDEDRDEWSHVAGFRFKKFPLNVVDSGGNLVAFERSKDEH